MSDYEATCASFRWNRPERFNFTGDVIDRWADSEPDRLALVCVDGGGNELRFSYADMAQASRRLCNVLVGAGVDRGDPVIVVLGRVPEWWQVVTAALRMGAVISPGTTQLSAKDLEYRINALRAACIVTDATGAAKVDEVFAQSPSLKVRIVVGGPREGWLDYGAAAAAASEKYETAPTAADEDALCYFTSGTTGHPKMCMHAHSYGLGHVTTGRFWLDLRPGDLHWNISDTGWAKAAWSSYFGPWNCGAAVFVHRTAAFDAKQTLRLLQRYPVTTMCGAPTVYRMLVLEDLAAYRFPSLRHCVSAGEPLNPEVIEKSKQGTGITIRDGYGQTETVLLCGSFPCIELRYGSMGRPAPGIDLRVIDDEGRELPPGTEGNIAVRARPEAPQGFFKGYRDAPEMTSGTFKGEWYLTGDRACMDQDGYFWFVGRADDLILSAGYRIGPFEVESALIEHPAVAESAVVSSPDGIRGEVVKAFVVLAPGYEGSEELKTELQEYVKKVTAPYKYPRRLEFLDSLPKTVSGKIRRIELRRREWQERSG